LHAIHSDPAMRILSTLLFFILFANIGFSQTGSITGNVIEKGVGALYGATVQIDGTAVGTVSDFDGKYTIRNVKAGTYRVRFYMLSYNVIIVENVKVEAGKAARVDAVMEMASTEIGPVDIIAEKPTKTIAAGMREEKEAQQVMNVTTADEIAQTPVSEAAGVAKFTPGVTVVDNRFVVVRGLSERYSPTLLNNVFAPSVEADVKVFALDLVPSAAIDRFIICKSPSADLPGEFAGGVVKIFTTNIPDSNSLAVNYGVGYRMGTTYDEFKLNKGSSTDRLGFDNGMRDLPGGLPEDIRLHLFQNPAAAQSLSESFSNNWGYESYKAPLDQRFGIQLQNRVSKYDSASKRTTQFGNITSINYWNTRSYHESNRLDYNTFNKVTMTGDTVFDYFDDIYAHKVRIGILQNNSLRMGRTGGHRLELKNMFNQIGDNESTFRGGRNIEGGETRQEYAFRYTERSIYSGQLAGTHEFNRDTTKEDRTKIDWTLGYSAARRNEPDWRRARYSRPFDTASFPVYEMYLPNSATPFFLGRIYINMKEDVRAGTVNFEHKFKFWDRAKRDSATNWISVKAGVYYEAKARSYTIRNIGYRSANVVHLDRDILSLPLPRLFEHIDDTTGLVVDEDTKPADQYTASNELQAGYLMGTFPLFREKLFVTGGVRFEHNVQQLFSYVTNTTIKSEENKVHVSNDILSVLPSANVSYNFTKKMLLRAGYGRTVNRPEFREIAPLVFYDFIFNSIYQGSDSLQTPTIDNYDMRWELYPSATENVTAGVFYKRFLNPIEIYFVPGVGSGGTRSFTWGNAPEAKSYGVEFEMRKGLDSLNVPFLKNLTFVANAAYIHSEITLTEDTANVQANLKSRPMMGQSPYVLNGGIYYRNDSAGLQVNATYNVVGPRVVIVGIPGLPEVYEMPRHSLDLTLIKTFGKAKHIEARFTAQDLLNAPLLLLQDANEDGRLDRETDQRMQYYRRGTYFTAGITVRTGLKRYGKKLKGSSF